MDDPHLNLIALNIPYPANYGGVIDIFYKVKALQSQGVKVILHCFEYGREHSAVLEEVCEKVYYYKRATGFLSFFSRLPYIVYSRRASKLHQNLLTNDYPILFEGLHTCYLLNHPSLKERIKVVRSCNIEHDYYNHLAYQEQNYFKKFYYRTEAKKLEKFEKILSHADHILAISQKDKNYFKLSYPNVKVSFIPGFHEYEQLACKEGKGEYLLFHGNLGVKENEMAALHLAQLGERLPLPLIIAGLNPTARLSNEVLSHRNVKLIANLEQEKMEELIKNAHAHLLITFQDTGLKLKLLHALFSGRYIIANSMMVEGTGLEESVLLADSRDDVVAAVESIVDKPFDKEALDNRREILIPTYTNKQNAEEIIQLIYSKE